MTNIASRYDDIFQENPSLLDLSDGMLFTEDGYTFPIHKIALAMCSPYFSALFCGLGKDKRDYVIPGISGKVLSDILTYIYSEKIQVTARNICDLIVASDYLLLDDLLSQMYILLEKKLTLRNCLATHIFLFQVNKKELLGTSYRFIQTHFEEILSGKCESFCNLPLEFLKQLFQDRNLRVQSESIVWQAIVKWVEADVPNRLQCVPDLLMYLRITDENESVVDDILTHNLVTKNAFCETVIFRSKTDYRNYLQSHQCNVWNDTQFGPFCTSRKPLRLNFLFYISSCPSNETKIYVTYDENLDLWRKIAYTSWYPDYLICIHECIYFFLSSYNAPNMGWNIIEKRSFKLKHFRERRFGQVFLALDRFVYMLGGVTCSHRTNSYTYKVKIYDPEENSWRDTAPMLPIVKNICDVTLNGFIYVVGLNTAGTGMSAQMYDPSTEIWNELPQPLLLSINQISLVSFNDKIYKFGTDEGYGAVNVEVFDPLNYVWHPMQSSPYTYHKLRALVINDQLIVCEDPHRNIMSPKEVNPPVQWNKERKNWEAIPESSPLFKIHFYMFCVQEGDSINEIIKENKSPTTVFRKSPFSSQ